MIGDCGRKDNNCADFRNLAVDTFYRGLLDVWRENTGKISKKKGKNVDFGHNQGYFAS